MQFKQDKVHSLAVIAVFLGLIPRLWEAFHNALNPDEALIFFIAKPGNWLERSLDFHHPPVFFLLMHYLQMVSESEIFLRLVPVLAGSLFPVVVYQWMRRRQYPEAGWVALLLLTFSPNLIALSAQMRGYTLVMLFSALAWYFLDVALEGKSIRSLLISTAFLYVAIATEYSAAFAVTAFGIHALFQLFRQGFSNRFRATWAASQVGGIVIYAFLYIHSIASLVRGTEKDLLVAGYLRGAFPKPGENLIWFACSATMKQFAYLMSSIPMGTLAAFLFVAGLWFVWRNQALRPWIGMLCLPFAFALFASLASVHPFGRTRHTIILGIFAAPGIGLGLHWLSSRLPNWRLPLATMLTVATFIVASGDIQNMPAATRARTNLIAAIETVRQRIPAGSMVQTDKETALLLKYYGGPRDKNLDSILVSDLHREDLAGLRLYFEGWDHHSVSRIQEVAARMGQNRATWVLDGGFAYLETPVPNAEFINNCLLLFPLP